MHHTDDASATIAFGGDHSRHVAWDVRSVTYDAADGRLLHVTGDLGGGYDTYRFLGSLHMAQFGGAPLRWLYFLLGLSTCVMIACGMQVWVAKRAQKIAASRGISATGRCRDSTSACSPACRWPARAC